MKLKKHTIMGISILFILAMLVVGLGAPPVKAVEVSGTCGDDLTWSLSSDGELTISGSGAMDDFDYDDMPWCDYRSSITSIAIKNGITSIGQHAFYFCTELKNVAIPDSIIAIEDRAFTGCSGLAELTIPKSVIKIGEDNFTNCTKLEGIWVDENNPSYYSDDYGVLFDKSVTTLIHTPALLSGNYVIPDGVVNVCSNAFANCTRLTGVMIPESVTSIGEDAFRDCTGLTSVEIPQNVESIDAWTFAGCSSLSNVEIAKGVERIGEYAFYDCTSLANVTIPESVIVIAESAFENCASLSGIVIPKSVTSIGGCAFGWCEGLKNVIIPEGVTNIGECAFYECYALEGIWVHEDNQYYCSDDSGVLFNKAMTELIQAPDMLEGRYEIPEGITKVHKAAFSDCAGLTNITIPDSVTIIGKEAFDNCTGLTSVAIPESITSIEGNTFMYCDSLSSITIPAGITGIDSYAFYSCDSLCSVVFLGDAPSIGSYAFGYIDADCYYPADNSTWSDDICQDYGGSLAWTQYYGDYPLLISQQPSDCTVIADDTCSFSVCVNKVDVSYQWQYRTSSDGSWVNISDNGSATSILTVFADMDKDSYEYRCMITDACGNVVVSDSATLRAIKIVGLTLDMSHGITVGENNESVYFVFTSQKTESYTLDFCNCTSWCSCKGYLYDDNGNLIDWGYHNISSILEANKTYYFCVENDGLGSFEAKLTITHLWDTYSDCEFCSLPVNGTCGDNLIWVLDDGTLRISGTGLMYDYGWYGAPWRDRNWTDTITDIVIEEGVTSIGDNAFWLCSTVRSITMPDSLISIGQNALGACSISEITIPDGVTSIGVGAFRDSGLTAIYIPDSVDSIGEYAFAYCGSLKKIFVDKNNPRYYNDDAGCLYDIEEKMLIRAPITIVGKYEIIPNTNIIFDYAFYNCKEMTGIVLPLDLKSIGTSSGRTMFWNCEALKEIIFRGDAPQIEESCFESITNATAYYPAYNETWNEDTLLNYGGDITWIAYYNILEGADSNIAADCDEDLTIRSSGDYSKFIGITVDDQTIDSSNYSVSEGSTIVTLHAEYLNELAEGEHTVTLIFTDGMAVTTLTIVDAVSGDVDGDGEISDWDAIVLNRYLAGWNVEVDLSAADVDGDGEVSDWDAIILERYLAGWDVKLES